MDPETVGSLVLAASNAAGMVKSIAEAVGTFRSQGKDGKESDETLDKISGLAKSLNAEILNLQEFAFRLQQERDHLHNQNVQLESANAKLHQQLGEKEEWATERKRYQLRHVRGATVLMRDDDPHTPYCPTCCEKDKLFLPIQRTPASRTSYRCSACSTLFQMDF